MTGIVLWALGFYLFHSYFGSYPRAFYIFSFRLCIRISIRCLGLTERLRVQFGETFSSSTKPLTSNSAIFVCEHEVKLMFWQDSIRSLMMRTLKYLLCVSSTNRSFHLPWKCQACKREPAKPIHVRESQQNPST